MKRFFIICVGAILLDRVVKYAVMSMMQMYQSIPLIQGVLHLTYIQNQGAAFGILQGQRIFFILVTLVVIALILIYMRQVKENTLLQVAFGLQLGGAVGNLIDRLAYGGSVIDFIDFRIIDFPVFNIADSAIVIGVALFALDVLREWKKERHAA